MAGNGSAVIAVTALVTALAAALWAVLRLRGRRGIATAGQRAAYEVLHTAGLAMEPLRTGLTPATAGKAARHLRALTGAAGLAVFGRAELLALDGSGEHHAGQLRAAAERVMSSGRSTVLGQAELHCDRVDCLVRGAVLAPLAGPDGAPAGALAAITEQVPAPGLVQATLETAHWAGTQLALAELDSSRERLARAEVRALRAQISPHFIYNALTAIASFVRTDPERARDLILEFAEFTRYAFRGNRSYVTLADELHYVEKYLRLEQVRNTDHCGQREPQVERPDSERKAAVFFTVSGGTV